MAKLITVFGATGNQGKSVVNALLDAPGFKVRALTRNPEGKEAVVLRERGCEVVKVNMDDSDSIENAIRGSYGVFAVTHYWGILAEESQKQNPNAVDDAIKRETWQGKTIGDVCKKLNVKHLVYSGLEHVQETIGKAVPHFDAKGIVEKYLDRIQVPNTSTRLAMYYRNFILSFIQKEEDGNYSITLPMNGPVHGLNVDDIGPVVLAIFIDPDKYIGKKLGISGDLMAMNEYVAVLTEVTGKAFEYKQVSHDTYTKLFPGSAELANMYEYYEKRKEVYDLEFTQSINPNVSNFRKWAEENKDKLMK